MELLLKRLLDISVIVVTAPVWGPLFLLTALAIRLEGPGPVFYGQERWARRQVFKVWKFRSMIPNADRLKAQLVTQQGLDPRIPRSRTIHASRASGP